MDTNHDVFQLSMYLFRSEYSLASILSHFDAGASYAASVSSLRRSNDDSAVLHDFDRFVCGGHVGTFANEFNSSFYERFRIFFSDFILSSAWDVQISVNFPRLLASVEFRVRIFFCVRGADVLSGSSQLEQVVNFVAGNTVWIVDVSVRTGDCDNFRTQLVQLQRGTPGYVTESGDCNFLAFQFFTVCFRTDIAVKLVHESLAETHNFSVGFASRVEVRTTFTAADWQASQAVLEDLLESQELDDSRIYVWSESQTTFVRSDCTVELVSVTFVNLYFTSIVNPSYLESDSSFRLNQSFQNRSFLIFRVLFNYWFQGTKNFFYSLMKFYFARVVLFAIFNYCFDVI